MDTSRHLFESASKFHDFQSVEQPWTVEKNVDGVTLSNSAFPAFDQDLFDADYDFEPPHMPILTAEEHRSAMEEVFSVNPLDIYTSNIIRPSSAPPDAGWHARDVRIGKSMDHEQDAALSLLDFATMDTRNGYSDYQNLFNTLNEELDSMTDCETDGLQSDEDMVNSPVETPRRSMLKDFGNSDYNDEEEDDRPMRARNVNYEDEPIRAKSLEPLDKPSRKVRAISPIPRRRSDPSKPASAIPPRLLHLLSKEGKGEEGASINSQSGLAERGHLETRKNKLVIVSELTFSIDEHFSEKKQRKMSTGVIGWNRLSWKEQEESPEDEQFTFEDTELLGTSLLDS
jgi:hypothetical protein